MPRKRKSKRPRSHGPVSPLQRLIRRGDLNIYEHTAADEILHAYHASLGMVSVRDPSLGLPAGAPQPGATDAGAAYRFDLVRTFSKWKVDLRGRDEMRAAIGLLIEERSLRDLDAAAGVRKGTMKARTVAALRHFAALRGNTPRGVRWRIE